LPPNVITPNGDGFNETFVLDKANAGWKLTIYNRWGEEVFSAADYNNDWGSKVKPAMYYYYLTSPDGDTCRGWIHVLQ
jgi:gliding motility-associated-like protein